MKKNRLMQELNRELDGVRVNDNLKARILAEAAASRAPSRRKSFSVRPLAIAAAVMVVCGLTAGMIALRQEKPDLSASTLSATKGNAAQKMVWVNLSEGLYHAKSDCEKVQDPVSMQLEDARAAGMKGCSSCIETGSAIAEDLVWMTSFGGYYHSVKDCSGMEDAVGVLEIEAKMLGRSACPVCLNGEIEVPSVEITPMPTLGMPSLLNEEKANEENIVALPEATWTPATPEPTLNSTPNPMYTPAPIATVMQMAQPTPMAVATAEPTQEPVSEVNEAEEPSVWTTAGGFYYHAEEHCSGIEGAQSVSLKQATVLEKLPCPSCIGEISESAEEAETASESVWVKEHDEIYYHSDAYCASGIFTAKEARQQDKAACAVCAENARDDDSVWMDEDRHFHLDKYCTERSASASCSESEAAEAGRRPCVLCMNCVWMIDGGVYYHTEQDCSGMQGAHGCSVVEALEDGKQPCPICAKQNEHVETETSHHEETETPHHAESEEYH